VLGLVRAAVWRVELADLTLARELARRFPSFAPRGAPRVSGKVVGTTVTLGVGDLGLSLDWAFDP